MKKLLSLLLALTLAVSLTVPAFAADTDEETTAAWELYYLGLFQGTGTDGLGFPNFALDQAPTRAQSVTMLVRLLGQEKAAQEGTWTTSFTDVPDWAAPYIGYAYENGLTTGRSETVFDPNTTVSATEYLTFVLRALGYASGEDFAWDSAWTLSDKLGFTDGSYNAETDRAFDRGDVAVISAAVLDVAPKGESKTLRTKLGLKSDAFRCQWEEDCVHCMPGELAFALTAVKDSKETYQKFEVDGATVNGVTCLVEQYSTRTQVKQFCKDQGLTKDLGNAFALVCLSFDESAAKAAATESITVGDETYPVLTVRFHAVGTLKDGTQVEEFFEAPYYADGYGGEIGDIF